MMNYFEYIGLNKKRESKNSGREVYIPLEKGKKHVAERYLQYLKEHNHYENDRRATIESKNSQLVGQASIVTSIFSLFVPLLIDKVDDFSMSVSIPLCMLFLLIMAHYLLAIIHSVKTLEIQKYTYQTRSTTSITKENRATTEMDFLNEEISDLISIINHSTVVDNIKANNLIFGARCFKIANIGFGILTVAIIITAFFFKKEIPEVRVNNLNEIRVITRPINNYNKNSEKTDTIKVKHIQPKRK